MAKRDFEQLVFQVRLGSKQKALQQALLIPWRRLLEAASAYAEWHIFVLWVRAIAEFEEQLPDIVRVALGARCPGFLDDEVPRRQGHLHDQSFLWHSLEEWIVAHQFAEAKSQGWFDALMFYAYKDLRTEQAWSLWERTKEAWNRQRPSRWPSFEEWTAQVIATHALTQSGSDKARAGEQLANVDPVRLRGAASELIELRGFALWMACISDPEQPLGELALKELRRRFPDFPTASYPQTIWDRSLFVRLVRFGGARWGATARAERWNAALQYHVVHHPRYHRLVHYLHRCHDEWLRAPPRSYPSFADWLRAADEYFVPPTS
jgi:hypothetical protein